MGIEARVVGNLLTNPEQKMVKVKGEPKKVTTLRIMADVYRRDENDQLVQDAGKSEPVNITVWNERLGDSIYAHFAKGCRIIAIGEQEIQKWDTDGVPNYQVHLTADIVGLVPTRIESIQFRAKSQANSEQQSQPA